MGFWATWDFIWEQDLRRMSGTWNRIARTMEKQTWTVSQTLFCTNSISGAANYSFHSSHSLWLFPGVRQKCPVTWSQGRVGLAYTPTPEHSDHLLGEMGADFDSYSVMCTEQRVGLMCLQYLTLPTCTGPFKLPGGLMPTEPVLPPHESELLCWRMINSLSTLHPNSVPWKDKESYLVSICGTHKDLHPKMEMKLKMNLNWLSHWVALEAL